MYGSTIFQDDVNIEDPMTISNLGKIIDNSNMRLQLPSINNFKIKASLVLKLLRDIIGKDLSKFSMPVWVNEPLSVLQKPAEIMYFVCHALDLAS
jgi:hypothetical protein